MNRGNVVIYFPTPYGPLVMSRLMDYPAMGIHRHVRAHCVFALRGSYGEGADRDSQREWQEGQVVLFPARYRHRTWFKSGEVVLASLKLARTALHELGLQSRSGLVTGTIDPALRRAVLSCINEFEDGASWAHRGPYLFALIDKALSGLSSTSTDGGDWLDRFRSHIDQSLAEKIRIPQLANEVKRHPFYAASCFKERFGVSVQQYVRRNRVRTAASLLLESGRSVTEAALAAGFADAAHFARSFRALCNRTASEFRDAKPGIRYL